MISATKVCPFCGEAIKAKAQKCRFCREFFATRPGEPSEASGEQAVNNGKGVLGGRAQRPNAQEPRAEQYALLLKWDGKIRLHAFDLAHRNLAGFQLAQADLSAADLTQANLVGANLTGANLTQANLADADLGGALLPRADLSGANLQGASLRHASLVGANLTQADLSGADLTEANLWGAKFNGTDLTQTNLWGAKLRGANFHGARYNATTQWPAGFTPPTPFDGSIVDQKKRD